MVRVEQSIFERAGLASGLLTDAQIDEAWHVLVATSPEAGLSLEEITDQQLATQLIRLGHLNQWQAEQLCQGRTKFTLGSYRIVDAIGHGGMGWVFKGEHELLGRVEAIKVLPRSQTNTTSIASFRREIRAQASLDHPNLVRLSYADTDGDTYFLVTEYIPGSDLRRLVHDHGPLPTEQAAIIISQAAEGLAHAHEQGLVHRDVKPGNLLITPEGCTKLTDLGLVFFSSEQEDYSRSKPKHVVGTADYLAPEIIATPGEVRAISDIYSLGCTLYYAVTGKVPYPSGATADKLRRHLEEEPIPTGRLNPNVDLAIVQVIEAMMQKNPEQRVATAAEVVLLLKPWVESSDAGVWQIIGRLAGQQDARHYEHAPLADTKPVIEPVLPHPFRGSSTERVPMTTSEPTISNAPVENNVATEQVVEDSIGQTITIITLALVATMAAIALALW